MNTFKCVCAFVLHLYTFVTHVHFSFVHLLGQNISLECCGIGNPVPVVSWRRVNSDLPIGRSEQIPGGLRIASVQLADAGQYVCELKNGVPPMIAQLITLEVQGGF